MPRSVFLLAFWLPCHVAIFSWFRQWIYECTKTRSKKEIFLAPSTLNTFSKLFTHHNALYSIITRPYPRLQAIWHKMLYNSNFQMIDWNSLYNLRTVNSPFWSTRDTLYFASAQCLVLYFRSLWQLSYLSDTIFNYEAGGRLRLSFALLNAAFSIVWGLYSRGPWKLCMLGHDSSSSISRQTLSITWMSHL